MKPQGIGYPVVRREADGPGDWGGQLVTRVRPLSLLVIHNRELSQQEER